jgi:uncharacterized BrkB/YihY/UPF0761 family membrane protein
VKGRTIATMRRALRRFWLTLRVLEADVRLALGRTFEEYVDDQCSELAAAISYYVLLSVFPLSVLVVSLSGKLLAHDDALRGHL